MFTLGDIPSAQGLLLPLHSGITPGGLGIEPGLTPCATSAECKAGTLSAILSPRPPLIPMLYTIVVVLMYMFVVVCGVQEIIQLPWFQES